MRYVYNCALRWSDLDLYGHINNARFLTLYEEARVALMFLAAREQGLTSFESGVVIFRHEVDYLRPVDYAPDPSVRIEMWVEQIRPSRFTIAYELFAGSPGAGSSGTGPTSTGPASTGPTSTGPTSTDPISTGPASRARTVCVPYDLAGGRPRRLTKAEFDFLAPWREPE